jgi:hypothetical protein
VRCFGEIIFDHSQHRLNETNFSEMWKTNQRLIISVASWETFTDNSTLALDAVILFFFFSFFFFFREENKCSVIL